MRQTLLTRIEHFFFRPVTTKGFGLLRVSFALITLLSFLFQWQDISTYYSDKGLVPLADIPHFLRTGYRFSLFDFIGDPTAIMWIYYLFILSLILVMLGIFTRPALLVSVILLFSFHERLWAVLAGGDTVLRLLAFILLLSPCHRSFSVWSLKHRFQRWNETGKDPVQKIAVMPAWPYLLLMWQMVVLYTASAWTKMLGSMWWDGSAISIALRHPFFSRTPLWFLPVIDHTAFFASHFILISQLAWVLLLILPLVRYSIPRSKQFLDAVPWKLIVILANALVHLLIAIFMDVGLFSFAMFAGYVGLLDEIDFQWLRRIGKRIVPGTTIVLFDGSCQFCRRSVFLLHTFDWMHSVSLVDYHETAKRKKIAPSIPFKKLDEEIHVKDPRGRFTSGFLAFRTLSWKAPPLWILTPFLYLPGVRPIGERVYAKIAQRRCKGNCDRETFFR